MILTMFGPGLQKLWIFQRSAHENGRCLRVDFLDAHGLLALFLIGVSLGCFITIEAPGKERSSATERPATTPNSTKAGTPPDPTQLEQLEAVQKQIYSIRSKVVQSTVAIRIGAVQGSGVVVSNDGHVLTAGHVIQRPGRMATIFLADGKTVKAKTLGVNATLDMGLLKMVGDGPWPHVKIGHSTKLKLGQWCLGAGHPGGYERDRAPAIRLGRVLSHQATFLVTDCTLTGGDSGGPLFDLNGRVVAIHSRIGSPLESNLHVPIQIYRECWQRLVDGELWGLPTEPGPYIGLTGDRESTEAKILKVAKHSPAEQAGLEPGDVVIRFEKSTVHNFRELTQKVLGKQPLDQVPIQVKRGAKKLDLVIEIGKRGG